MATHTKVKKPVESRVDLYMEVHAQEIQGNHKISWTLGLHNHLNGGHLESTRHNKRVQGLHVKNGSPLAILRHQENPSMEANSLLSMLNGSFVQ